MVRPEFALEGAPLPGRARRKRPRHSRAESSVAAAGHECRSVDFTQHERAPLLAFSVESTFARGSGQWVAAWIQLEGWGMAVGFE